MVNTLYKQISVVYCTNTLYDEKRKKSYLFTQIKIKTNKIQQRKSVYEVYEILVHAGFFTNIIMYIHITTAYVTLGGKTEIHYKEKINYMLNYITALGLC